MKRFICYIFTVLVGTGLASGVSYAAGGEAALLVTPVRQELSIAPGQVATKPVRITNRSNDRIRVVPSARDYSPADDGDDVIYERNPNKVAVASWVRIGSTGFELAPGESRDVAVTLVAPQRAPVGSYYATTLFTAEPLVPSEPAMAQVAGKAQVGSLFFITVEPVALRSGEIAAWRHMAPWHAARLTFMAGFRNNGDTFLRPKGTVVVKDWLGREVERIPTEGKTVIQGTTRNWQIMGSDFHLPGRYRAELQLEVPGTVLTPSAVTGFWLIPWWFVVLVSLFALTLGGIWARRYRRQIAEQEHLAENRLFAWVYRWLHRRR